MSCLRHLCVYAILFYRYFVPTGLKILVSDSTDKSVGYFHLSLGDKMQIYKNLGIPPLHVLVQERLLDLRSLDGKNILITSGPTRGYIDAVRYISNKSTGALGAAIAMESLKRDASVTFVYGTGSAIPNTDVLSKNHASRFTPIEIETIDDLLTAVQQTVKGKPFNAIIHAMAVLDYIPEKQSNGKISSNQDKLTVTFVRAPKVIKLIRTLWPQTYLVGFKLEVGLSNDELIAKAYTSLQENRADLVVANNQNEIAGGKHYAYLINTKKEVESRCETKQGISSALMDLIALKC